MSETVLILCTGNSARSQMAEGWLSFLASDRFEIESAGTQPSKVHPLAVQVMAERSIDLSGHRSKHLEEFREREFDYVITVCDRAAETCPVFAGPARRLHWSFPDPAAVDGTDDERLAGFRAVRDSIEKRLRTWLSVTELRGEGSS